jgi:hypothetical protein
MVRVPAREPVAEGVKVRLTVQLELGAMVAPFTQLPPPGLAKFVALVPPMTK